MYFSRHCYDKPHRCPGWIGGGWKYPKKDRCEGGYLNTDYVDRWYEWRFHRCSKCDVVALPIVVKYLDPSWLWYELKMWIQNR